MTPQYPKGRARKKGASFLFCCAITTTSSGWLRQKKQKTAKTVLNVFSQQQKEHKTRRFAVFEFCYSSICYTVTEKCNLNFKMC